MLNNTASDNFERKITPPCAIYVSFPTIELVVRQSFTCLLLSRAKADGTRPKWLIQEDATLNISLIYYEWEVIIKFGQPVLLFEPSLNFSLPRSSSAIKMRVKTMTEEGGRERERRKETKSMREKTFERVKQADEFINFKSCQQCRPVGGAFMALRSGPTHPCPPIYLIPNLAVWLPIPYFYRRPASHDAQLIIFFEASRLIDRAL